ncbi:TRL-like family protein [Pseudomonadota bacterium]
MRKINKFIAVTSLVLTGACAMPLNSAGPGFIFTQVTEGVSVNNSQRITKAGEACSMNILGVVSTGDSSVRAAKNDGNITNIATMDRDYFGVLGLFSKSCLIVKGN